MEYVAPTDPHRVVGGQRARERGASLDGIARRLDIAAHESSQSDKSRDRSLRHYPESAIMSRSTLCQSGSPSAITRQGNCYLLRPTRYLGHLSGSGRGVGWRGPLYGIHGTPGQCLGSERSATSGCRPEKRSQSGELRKPTAYSGTSHCRSPRPLARKKTLRAATPLISSDRTSTRLTFKTPCKPSLTPLHRLH